MENSIVKDVEKIVKENITTVEIGGKTFTNQNLSRVKTKDEAEKIIFNDLSSIVELIKHESSKFELPLYINIRSHERVSVFSSMDSEKDREIPYEAECRRPSFDFGRWTSYEDFVIALRSLFIENEDSKELLNLIKNITNSNAVETEDDGVTQKIVQKNGTSLGLGWGKSVTPIRNLIPYRTFIEIEQPASDFLFRIKETSFALFEADGGAWKMEAQANIRKYFEGALSKEIKDGQVVIVG